MWIKLHRFTDGEPINVQIEQICSIARDYSELKATAIQFPGSSGNYVLVSETEDEIIGQIAMIRRMSDGQR